MEAKATAKTVRISASKARLVTRLISGRPVPDALRILQFSSKKAARLVEKVLRSAVANAAARGAIQAEELKVTAATADEGPRMRRFRPAPRGRAMRIIKRTSHISVTVADQQ